MGFNKTSLGPVTVDVQENLSLGPEANYTIYDYFPTHGKQLGSRDGDYWELCLNKNLCVFFPWESCTPT